MECWHNDAHYRPGFFDVGFCSAGDIAPLNDADLAAIARRAAALLAPGGLLLLVNHYFFGFDRASRETRRIHDQFRADSLLKFSAEHRRGFFLATLMQAD